MAELAEPSSREALPLTFDNAFEVVKTVRLSWSIYGWRELAEVLLGWFDFRRDDQKKLDAIERGHVSDDARFKAVVEMFLLGEGHYQPSWRRLIHALHLAQQSHMAEKIKTNAEPHHDPTMMVDNVTQILNKIPADKWERVMGGGGLGIPWPLLEEIQGRYSTDTEKNHACADYYVNCHPDAEWKHLTTRLYFREEYALARESKSFMSTDPTLTVDNVSHVMEKVEPKVKMDVWAGAYTDILERMKMRELCLSGKEDKCADLYVNCNPNSSWELLARSLYDHHQVAAVEEVRSYLPPRDLTITTKKLMELFAPLDPGHGTMDVLGGYLDPPQSEIARIWKDYQSPTQRKEAYLHYWI